MIRCLVTFAVLGSCSPVTPPSGPAVPVFPDSTLTPGAVVAGCTPSTVGDRNVTKAEKRDLLAAYGLPADTPSSAVRFDHRIPHALCGADTPDNLWPEATEASYTKDGLERAWINLVKLDPSMLTAAQGCFRRDWTHCGATS